MRNRRRAPVADVVEGALGLCRQVGTQKVGWSGPTASPPAKVALSLALALHELATTAAKYGASLVGGGRVEVSWNVAHEAGREPRFHLAWVERGGLPVLGPPERKKFGSPLIERSFTAETGGDARLTYERDGLVCRMEVPLAIIHDPVAQAAGGPANVLNDATHHVADKESGA